MCDEPCPSVELACRREKRLRLHIEGLSIKPLFGASGVHRSITLFRLRPSPLGAANRETFQVSGAPV